MCGLFLLLTAFLYGLNYANAAPSAGIGYDTDKGITVSLNLIPRLPLHLLRESSHVKNDHHGTMGISSGLYYTIPCPVDSMTQPWNPYLTAHTYGDRFCIKGSKPLNPWRRSPSNDPPKMSADLPEHQFSRLLGIPEYTAES